MIDKNFCMSSFLALRYIERSGVDFSSNIKYRYPVVPSDLNKILVNSSRDISDAIETQIVEKCGTYKKIGILLSGGMDSGILASYFPGIDAYTFRFLDGDYKSDELKRAELIAKTNNMILHYVDINWTIVMDNIWQVMQSKGGPVHSIETQICHAAKQARADGVDLMIIGDASDIIFGGLDKLLSKDWAFDDFVKRYIYIDPFLVLKSPVSVNYLFERYRDGDSINFLDIIEKVFAQESYGSYDNAFRTAGLDYFDPYKLIP